MEYTYILTIEFDLNNAANIQSRIHAITNRFEKKDVTLIFDNQNKDIYLKTIDENIKIAGKDEIISWDSPEKNIISVKPTREYLFSHMVDHDDTETINLDIIELYDFMYMYTSSKYDDGYNMYDIGFWDYKILDNIPCMDDNEIIIDI